MNAILNYRGNKKDLEHAKIYVDLFPCNECAKIIIQSGIKEVVYLSNKYADSENKNLQVAGLGFAPDDRLDGC